MPIYEFYCARCHRIYSFLSRVVDTAKSPNCPRCQGRLARQASAFAISKGRSEPAAALPGAGEPDFDDGRLEKMMSGLAGEAEGLDEDDPRQAARFMRRLYEGAGMPVEGGVEEALRRMESGEDPDKIEEEMGDVFGEGPLGDEAGPKDPKEPKKSLARLRRRALPPQIDPGLYEM